MNDNNLFIGNKSISLNKKPYFIADIASNHDGDINRAYKLIELAKESGADCAKFQNFSANKIVSKIGFKTLDKNMSHQSSWKNDVFEVYENCSVPKQWTEKLKAKCNKVGIEYMSSPYDYESVELIEPYVNAYKIGSGDITWIDMLEYIAYKDKPVLLATGASSLEDVKRAMNAILKINKRIVLMQCNTNYTVNKDNFKYVNLNVLKQYKELYPECILGLSDHTPGYSAVLGSIALGARVIEKHFTDDNDREGPDHKFSLNPTTWKCMVQSSMELFLSLGDGNKKIEENEKETSIVQRRCLYYQKDLVKGEIINKNDLFPLRPAKEDGIYPFQIEKIIGKKLTKDVKEDEYVRWEDISDD